MFAGLNAQPRGLLHGIVDDPGTREVDALCRCRRRRCPTRRTEPARWIAAHSAAASSSSAGSWTSGGARENVACGDRAWARALGLAMAPRGRSLWRLPGRGAKRRGRQRPDLGGALRDSQRLAIVIELDWLSVEELVAGAVAAHIDAQPAPAVQEPEDEAVEP